MLELPHTRFSRWVDSVSTGLGGAVSWLWLVLLGVIVLNVVMRYLFSEGRIEFEETQWHLYAVGFLVGLSYAYTTDSHIRVDVVRERFSLQTQAWIELYGTLILMLPFVLLVLIGSVPFVSYSFETSEISDSPGGLPYRWLIKSALFVGFALLLMTVIARLSRIVTYLFLDED